MVLPCNWIFVGNRLRVSNLRWGLNEKIWKQEIPQTHVGPFSIVFNISLNPMSNSTIREARLARRHFLYVNLQTLWYCLVIGYLLGIVSG